MGKIEEYLDRAKKLAEEAGEVAKTATGEAVGRAKELAEERSKVKELMNGAKEQTAAYSMNAKEKVQGLIQDAKAGKEIQQGISELEALEEVEGSILYTMELQTITNYLKSTYLIIRDKRLDDESVADEIKKVAEKVQPAGGSVEEMTEEQQAIEKAKAIAFDACIRALDSMKA